MVGSRCIVVLLVLIAGCGEKSTTPPKGPPLDGRSSWLDRAATGGDGAASRFEHAVAIADSASPGLDHPPPIGADGLSPVPGRGRNLEEMPPALPGGSRPLDVAPSAPVGHLERRDRLGRLFEALGRLDGGHSTDDVRILQYGDSHTASDLGTSVFRRALQTRFGDGGRGFVSLGKPWKTYAQDGVRGGMTDGFEPVRFGSHTGSSAGTDGCCGLLGVAIGTSKDGERAWTEIAAHTTRLELDYWQSPSTGSFEVFIDGGRAGRVATHAEQPASAYFSFDVADGPHQVELRTVGDGEVRVFGMTLDRAQPGVVVDALGINGAQIFTALRWKEEHFAEQLRHRAPDLVMLAYGTNESLEPRLSDTEYERGLVDFLGRIARATTGASCLLLGPPDLAVHTKGPHAWASAPRVVEIIAIQRRVAGAAGCAFYDQLEAMGGPGSIAAWAAEPEPRAQRDRMHLTRSGYAQLGTSFAADLLRGYDGWRAERGLKPSNAPRTLGVASQ
jgi:lysophospholipase L1-like esterase